jgi:hypothetical protein
MQEDAPVPSRTGLCIVRAQLTSGSLRITVTGRGDLDRDRELRWECVTPEAAVVHVLDFLEEFARDGGDGGVTGW